MADFRRFGVRSRLKSRYVCLFSENNSYAHVVEFNALPDGHTYDEVDYLFITESPLKRAHMTHTLINVDCYS